MVYSYGKELDVLFDFGVLMMECDGLVVKNFEKFVKGWVDLVLEEKYIGYYFIN